MNLKLFRNKNFSLIVFGEIISLFGTQFQSYALSLYVLKITGSAAKFASVLALGFIPQIILGPVSGVFVDRLDRKKIILIINTLNCIVIAALASVYMANGGLKMSYIYIAVMIMSVNSVIFDPAVSTVFPSILEKEQLMSANSVYTLIKSVAGILSPMMAGAIYVISGLLPILIINSVSFIMATFFESFLSLPKVKREISKFDFNQFKDDFAQGFRYIWNQKLILNIAIAAFIINFAIAPLFSVGLIYIVKRVLGCTDMQYGLVCTILGLGELPGPFIAGMMSKKSTPVRIFMKGMVLVACTVACMALINIPAFLRLFHTNLIPLAAVVAVTIIVVETAIVVNINMSTLTQTIVPNDMLGRISSVSGTCSCAAVPLGQIIFGGLFDVLPAFIVIFICSAIIFASTLTFRNIKKFENKGVSELSA